MYKKKRKKDISKNFDRLTLIFRKQRQEFCSNIAVMSYRQQITTERRTELELEMPGRKQSKGNGVQTNNCSRRMCFQVNFL